MATTIMLLSVLTALLKAILFSDDRINKDRYTADISLAVPYQYGSVNYGVCGNEDYIRIEVDPNTLNVTSFFDIESCVNPGIFYYVAITWDVKDPSSIGRNIFAIRREVDSWDWFTENRTDEEQVINIKINNLAHNMNNNIVKIAID